MNELTNFLKIYNSLFANFLELYQFSAFQNVLEDNNYNNSITLMAEKALVTFQGDKEVIVFAKQQMKVLEDLGLTDTQEYIQLNNIVLAAAEYPGTNYLIANKRLLAEARQTALTSEVVFNIGKAPISLSEIDQIFYEAKDVNLRREIYEAYISKGNDIGSSLSELVMLRNETAREMNFSSYFSLQTQEMKLQSKSLLGTLDAALESTQPLFHHLKNWTCIKIAEKYNLEQIPELLPADLLSDRFGQSWSGLVDVGIDMDKLLSSKNDDWIINSAQEFWCSLGFPRLPNSFWKKSILYPDKGDELVRFGGASCWHMDMKSDIRAILKIRPTFYWYGAVHHELGHAYHYLTCGGQNIAPLLKTGTSRAVQEGIAEFAKLLSLQPAFLKSNGLIRNLSQINYSSFLLKECLEVGLPLFHWSAGTVSHFEYDIYENELSYDFWQKHWANCVAKYQCIDIIETKIRSRCDAALVEHINLKPCYYYNYAIATMIKYQLYDILFNEVLGEDSSDFSIHGNKKAGEFLYELMNCANNKTWGEFCNSFLSGRLSVQPMISRYEKALGNL